MAKKKKLKSKEFKVPETRKKIDNSSLKPIQIIDVKQNGLIAFAIFVFTMIIYQLTNAPSLSFWDAGEYATTINIFSVLHAPGNPTYVILGRFLNILGLGMSVPQIASFFSSLLGALGVMFTYLYTVKIVSMFEKSKVIAVSIGAVSALLTAFSMTYWTNCIEAEVYSGLAFFINFIIYLLMVWVQKSENFDNQNYIILIAFLFFFGFGVHQTVLQIVPAVLLIAIYPIIRPQFRNHSFWTRLTIWIIGFVIFYAIMNSVDKNLAQPFLALAMMISLMFYLKDYVSFRAWLLIIIAIILGFSTHLYIPIRASFRPFINEGDPQTLERFMAFFRREQFGGSSIIDRNGSFLIDQLGFHFFRYFNWQFFNTEMLSKVTHISQGVISLIANLITYLSGILGGIFLFKKNKHAFVYLTSLLFMGSIAMVYVMNIPLETPRPRDYFFVTAYNLWASYMGLGIIYGLKRVIKCEKLTPVVIIIALLFPALSLISNYHFNDRSRAYYAAEYGMNCLNSLEENAIIFTNGDNDTFPLWYAQAIDDPYIKEHQPQQIPLFDYDEPDFNGLYPDVDTQNNIERAMIFKNKVLHGIRKDVTIANYSLMNTPWYIRQLRDREGINLSVGDRDIERLVTPEAYQRPITYRINTPGYQKNFRVTEKDLDQGFWRGQDKACMQIIKDNFGRRPIYFAATVGSQFMGLDEYLESHVLVYKLVPVKMDKYQSTRWDLYQRFLEDQYVVDSILDNTVYKDDAVARLTAPYIQHFDLLGRYYSAVGENQLAINAFNNALQVYDSIKRNSLPWLKELSDKIVTSKQKVLNKKDVNNKTE